MNKHVVNALSSYNFSFEKTTGYGFINDYEVNVVCKMTMAGPLFIFSTYLSETKKNEIKNEIVEKFKENKISLCQIEAFDFGIMVLVGCMTAGSFEKKFAQVLPLILEALESVDAPKSDICPQTGEKLDEQDSKLVYLNDLCSKIRISNKGIEAVNINAEKSNEEFDKAPNNYPKGFLGILAGALAGVAITVICALLGYVTAFASFVSVFLGVYLYKKFGGKPNYVMIVMSLVTTLVVILGIMTLLYVGAANGYAEEAGLSIKGFEALKYCINNDEEFKKEFLLDLGLNGLFILIGEGASISSLIRMIKRPQGIQ